MILLETKKDKLEERLKYIELKTKKLEEEQKDLTDNERKLLALRKISDIAHKSIEDKKSILDFRDEIKVIINASNKNVNTLDALLLYGSIENAHNYKELYRESFERLQNILKTYKVLSSELNINDPLELCILFTYLLWNGYFSVSKEHTYELKKRLLLTGLNSFDIIKGHGVCLAYSELLDYFLKECNKSSALLYCEVPTKKGQIVRGYTPDIKRNINVGIIGRTISKSAAPMLKGVTSKFGNHAVTLVEDDDKLYVYDTTNLYVLNIINPNTASIINGQGEFSIKPLNSIISSSDYLLDDHIIERLITKEINKAFDDDQIIEYFDRTLEIVKRNNVLIEDAYNCIHNDLEFIDNQTNEIGGVFKANKIIRKKKSSTK